MSFDLGERWRKEIEFHDHMAEEDTRWTTFRAYGLSAAAIRYAQSSLGDTTGKVIVDCGCGHGQYTVDLIGPNRTLLAFDISGDMLRAARAFLTPVASERDCKLAFQQMAAEQIGYASESVDTIIGISVLHHLDIPTAIHEIKRVLKPGGRAVFVEPLNHNPIAGLYRLLTSDRHSETETPLDYSIFQLLEEHFQEVRHKEFYLFSLFSAIFAFVHSKSLFDCVMSLLFELDEHLMNKMIWTRRYAWLTVIELIK